jgi:hypothetical protein
VTPICYNYDGRTIERATANDLSGRATSARNCSFADLSMLSDETLEQYRKMTPGERLALTFRLTQEAETYLFAGTREQVKRRFQLLRRQNDERNLRMLEGLARVKHG